MLSPGWHGLHAKPLDALRFIGQGKGDSGEHPAHGGLGHGLRSAGVSLGSPGPSGLKVHNPHPSAIALKQPELLLPGVLHQPCRIPDKRLLLPQKNPGLLLRGLNKLLSIGKKPEAPKAPTTKICPFCKSEIALDATRCPHCTSQLN